MRKKHKMIHLTRKDIEEVKHIQKTTTCNYNKRGNVNDTHITRNVTVARYGTYYTVLHYRKDLGTHHYYINKVNEIHRKYGKDAVIAWFGNDIKLYYKSFNREYL